VVRAAGDDEAQLEAGYRWDTGAFDLNISTASMDVATLHSQAALRAVPWLEQVRSGNWNGQLRYQWDPGPPAAPGWSGQFEIRNAAFALDGLAAPVTLDTARVRIQGERVVLDRMLARVGGLTAQGEYRYEPLAARPHRIRVAIPAADAAQIERLFTPTLLRTRNLLARAFSLGRAAVPAWLAGRRMEGSVQIGALRLGGLEVDGLRARLVWDGARARLENITGRLEGGVLNGTLTVNLRGSRPAYLLAGRLRNVDCRSGKVDAEGALETQGIGAEVLANLRSQGIFKGSALELGSLPPVEAVAGAYRLVWGAPEPRVRFWDLQLTSGDEVYAGSGATQDDGRLLIQLTSGAKEMRMSGSFARLALEEAPAP
jgi:hypothetical protein